MGCDCCLADCLNQDLQDFGIFGMAGTPLALERSYGCLNFDFWDFGDGQDGRRGVGELLLSGSFGVGWEGGLLGGDSLGMCSAGRTRLMHDQSENGLFLISQG